MNFGQIQRVLVYELKQNIRRKSYLFTTFGLPLLAILGLLGFQFYTAQQDRSVREERAQVEETLDALAGSIERAGYVDFTGRFDDPGAYAAFFTAFESTEAAQEALDAGEIDVFYVIESDYVETGAIQTVVPRFSLVALETDLIEAFITSTLAPDVDPNLIQRAQFPINLDAAQVSSEESLSSSGQLNEVLDTGASFVMVYAVAFLLMFSLFVTSGYLMQSVIGEKESRLIEILLSSLRPLELLSGKILGLGVLGLLQMLVWLTGLVVLAWIAGATGIIESFSLLNIQIAGRLMIVLLVYFLLAYFLYAAVYGAIGALTTTTQEGSQLAAVIVLPTILPIYLLGVYLESPSSTWVTVLSILPLTSVLGMPMRIVVVTVPLWQIGLSVLLMLVAVGLMTWLAARLFRVQALLAGKRPRLRDLPRLVFRS